MERTRGIWGIPCNHVTYVMTQKKRPTFPHFTLYLFAYGGICINPYKRKNSINCRNLLILEFIFICYILKGAQHILETWARSHYSDLTLSQEFQPTAAQLSMKAALPLAKILATASCLCSKRGPRAQNPLVSSCFLWYTFFINVLIFLYVWQFTRI